jgi:hypothetical protein
MALPTSLIYNKPVDEPFRQWDLETCVHCHSHLDLHNDRCQRCGHARCSEDIRMADEIRQYRQSAHGLAQYQMILDHEQAQHDFNRVLAFVVGLFVTWPIFWFVGFLIWGSGAWFAGIASLGFAAWLYSRV